MSVSMPFFPVCRYMPSLLHQILDTGSGNAAAGFSSSGQRRVRVSKSGQQRSESVSAVGGVGRCYAYFTCLLSVIKPQPFRPVTRTICDSTVNRSFLFFIASAKIALRLVTRGKSNRRTQALKLSVPSIYQYQYLPAGVSRAPKIIFKS